MPYRKIYINISVASQYLDRWFFLSYIRCNRYKAGLKKTFCFLSKITKLLVDV